MEMFSCKGLQDFFYSITERLSQIWVLFTLQIAAAEATSKQSSEFLLLLVTLNTKNISLVVVGTIFTITALSTEFLTMMLFLQNPSPDQFSAYTFIYVIYMSQ